MLRTLLIIVFIIIAGFGVFYLFMDLVMAWANQNHDPEKLDPAEEMITAKYDSLFSGVVHVSMNKDWQAEDKMYKYRYGHGIYHIVFESKPGGNDFKIFPTDSLNILGKQVTNDFVPIMTNKDLYDSILIYFITNYPVKKEGGIVVADTSSLSFIKTFEYPVKSR